MIPDTWEFVYAQVAVCECLDRSPMDSHELLCRLQKTGRVRFSEPTAVPLTGGVSSEIWRVTDGSERFVVKRALSRLSVRDDWFADPVRNRVEHDCLAYLNRIACGSVLRILFR